MALQATTGIHQPTKTVHRPVHHVAGSTASRMVISHDILLGLLAELRQHGTDRSLPALSAAPLLELSHQTPKFVRRRDAVNVPNPPVPFVILATTVADLQKAVQKAEDHGNRGKQRPEGVACGRPTVGVDGFGGVLRGEALCFGGELAVRLAEVVVIGRVGQSDTQDGVVADGHGDVALLTGPVDMMFVGGQVFGQLGRVADGGPHQARAAQSLDESIPVHFAVAEADFEEPRWDAVCCQEERVG